MISEPSVARTKSQRGYVSCLWSCGCWVAELGFDLSLGQESTCKTTTFILFPSVQCCLDTLAFHFKITIVYLVPAIVLALGRGRLYTRLIDWSSLFASHCAVMERSLYWRVNNSHIYCPLSGEGALGAFICIDDHALYQAILLLWPQLTGSGMDTWPKGSQSIGWPGVHEVVQQERSARQLLTGCGQTT